jgi:hypothetical protein
LVESLEERLPFHERDLGHGSVAWCVPSDKHRLERDERRRAEQSASFVSKKEEQDGSADWRYGT